MNAEKIAGAVEKNSALILDAERYIWKHPETGYREWKTQEYLKEKYEALGYTLTFAGNIPGFYTDFDTGRPGPRVLIMGELDSLIVDSHPEADPETGAVHACGHNAQSAALLGIAAALKEPGVADELCGSVRLCAVPAEELIEIDFRKKLIDEGVVSFYNGKMEFMSRGFFDDCDMDILVHTAVGRSNRLLCTGGSNGVMAKTFTFKGKSAHAGASPYCGVNALYAANAGLSAVNALRETFRDDEKIRFHPIITEGGTAVNAIPEKVSLESYVRGVSLEAIIRENKKINRALAGSAAALGAQVEISEFFAFAPFENDKTLEEIGRNAAMQLVPAENVAFGLPRGGGSTDMGDMCCVMPTFQPFASGASGISHGADYLIADPVSACVLSAKFQLLVACTLLCDGAKEARRVMENFTPPFKSIKDYIDFRKTLDRSFEAVTYNDDGTITLKA